MKIILIIFLMCFLFSCGTKKLSFKEYDSLDYLEFIIKSEKGIATKEDTARAKMSRFWMKKNIDKIK